MSEEQKVVRKSDVEVLESVKNLDVSNPDAVKEALYTVTETVIDIRRFLRKIYKNMPKSQKVYKRPTENKGDVIVGK